MPRVGVNDNFFDLGGHSLLCLQVVAQIEKRTGTKLSPQASCSTPWSSWPGPARRSAAIRAPWTAVRAPR